MTFSERQVIRLHALAALERAADQGLAGTALELHRVCRTGIRILPATGVAVSLMSATGLWGVVAKSDSTAGRLADVQSLVGEGPSLEAFHSLAPVLVPDLLAESGRWPGYADAAGAFRVGALYSFPLRTGASTLGVLEVHREDRGPLAPGAFDDASALAHIATYALLRGQERAGEDASPHGIEPMLESRYVVHQAQGMLMVRLGVPPPTALLRLRAYAYAHGIALEDAAKGVIAGTLTIDVDRREPQRNDGA